MELQVGTQDTAPMYNFYDGCFGRAKVNETVEDGWEEEETVSFREFVTSPDHMNFEPFSERQYGPIEYMLGMDRDELFFNNRYMAVLEWGKGCIAGETELEDALTGEKSTVAELCKKRKQVFVKCIDDDLNGHIQLASIPWVKGEDDLYKVRTTSGKEVCVTMKHKFLSRFGWVELGSLKVGDEILDDATIDCAICGRKSKNLALHIQTWDRHNKRRILKHGITLDEYKSKYGKVTADYLLENGKYIKGLSAEERKKKFGSKGEKHPLYGTHQGEDSRRRNRESQPTLGKTIDQVFSQEECDRRRKFCSLPGSKNGMYGKHPGKGAGRCKWETVSISSGDILIQGSYEKRFVLLFDKLGVKMERNKRRFLYKDQNGLERTYSPDFVVMSNDKIVYIELKGWVTEETYLKLQAVKDSGEQIELIDKERLRSLEKRFSQELKWDKISSIEFYKRDKFYDLEVPVYHNFLAQGLYHHNSGKDTIAWAFVCYLVYVLLNLKNPQRYLGQGSGEPIDILNVANTEKQASGIFFDRLRTKVKNWKWLMENYHVKLSGSSMSSKEKDGVFLDHVQIRADGVVFPKGVRVFSGNSSQESYEGTNLLCFIMDEASAFRDGTQTHNAQKMFDMLRSSATSRFGMKYKSIMMSFPRYKDDFIERTLKVYESNLNVYTDKAMTWDVKPQRYFSDKMFKYGGMDIPVDFQDEFKFHPESSLIKYCCIANEAESPLFSRSHMIDLAVNRIRKPIFEFEEYEDEDKFGQKYLLKKISVVNCGVSSLLYVIVVDLGRSGDSAALSIGHLDEETGKIILDAHTAWTPIPERNVVVSLSNVEEILLDICKLIQVGGIFFDRWQSYAIVESLIREGNYSNVTSVKFKDWLTMRDRFYGEQMEILPDMDLVGQLKQMQNIKDMKIDHPVDGHDDRAYSLAGLVKILTELSMGASKATEDGEIVGSNLQAEGSVLKRGGISPDMV